MILCKEIPPLNDLLAASTPRPIDISCYHQQKDSGDLFFMVWLREQDRIVIAIPCSWQLPDFVLQNIFSYNLFYLHVILRKEKLSGSVLGLISLFSEQTHPHKVCCKLHPHEQSPVDTRRGLMQGSNKIWFSIYLQAYSAPAKRHLKTLPADARAIKHPSPPWEHFPTKTGQGNGACQPHAFLEGQWKGSRVDHGWLRTKSQINPAKGWKLLDLCSLSMRSHRLSPAAVSPLSVSLSAV